MLQHRSEFTLFARGVRAGILFVLAAFLLLLMFGNLLRGQETAEERAYIAEEKAITAERRITAIETKLEYMSRDLADLRSYGWPILLGVAALLGERGYGLLKDRARRAE